MIDPNVVTKEAKLITWPLLNFFYLLSTPIQMLIGANEPILFGIRLFKMKLHVVP